MIHSLQNSFLQLTVNQVWPVWGLTGLQARGPSLDNVNIGVIYRHGRSRHQAIGAAPMAADGPETVEGPHGRMRQLTLVGPPDSNAVRCRVIFALPQDYPFLFIKVGVENLGSLPVHLGRIDVLNAGFVFIPSTASSISRYAGNQPGSPPPGRVRLAPELGDLAFFSNGWQSWSYTGVYALGERFRRTRFGPLRAPVQVNAGTPQPRGRSLYSSDMFGVFGDRLHRTAVLGGFLSQANHFGSLEALVDPFRPALRMWANGDWARLDPGQDIYTDWACISFLHLDTPDPLAPYLEAVARENGVNPIPAENVRAGWSSWYFLYQNISEENLREELAAASSLQKQFPLELFQIDDGFQSQVGDWFSFSHAFPRGLKPLAADIRQAGFEPGLWLAPFIVHRKSRLFKEHPDWILRNRFGRPVNTGFLWNSFPTALDLTKPAALDYAAAAVRTAVQEWGFRYLKLDFLYAAALPGCYHDGTQTRAQVLRKGLLALRSAAGDGTYLVGCGCPLGPAVGVVDAMRIGPDVERFWKAEYKGIKLFVQSEPDAPSARNAVHNTLTRGSLHRRWWVNDPDALILRTAGDHKGAAQLSLTEVQTLATVIGLSGGSLLISDHLPNLPLERLRIAEVLLPLVGSAAHVIDWFDSTTPEHLQLDLSGPVGRWHLVALFNWADAAQRLVFFPNEFYLDSQTGYLARSFWDGKTYLIPGKQPAEPELAWQVPAHGAVLLALRPARPFQPQYLGSDLHFSQGLEVTAWEWSGAGLPPERTKDKQLHLRLERPGRADGIIDLALSHPPEQARLNGRTIQWDSPTETVFRFPVRFEKTGDLEIDL